MGQSRRRFVNLVGLLVMSPAFVSAGPLNRPVKPQSRSFRAELGDDKFPKIRSVEESPSLGEEFFNAFLDDESRPIDVVAYSDIEKECYHFIYNVHRNLLIWEWPDSMVKHILKTHLEEYLIEHLNTPESRKLHIKYEAADWNIHAMMEMHLFVDE